MFTVPDQSDKQALVEGDGPWFTTPHFDGYNAVLLRRRDLGRLTRAELAEVIADAWWARRRPSGSWRSSSGRRSERDGASAVSRGRRSERVVASAPVGSRAGVLGRRILLRSRDFPCGLLDCAIRTPVPLRPCQSTPPPSSEQGSTKTSGVALPRSRGRSTGCRASWSSWPPSSSTASTGVTVGSALPEHYFVVRAGLSPSHARDVVAIARRRHEVTDAALALARGTALARPGCRRGAPRAGQSPAVRRRVGQACHGAPAASRAEQARLCPAPVSETEEGPAGDTPARELTPAASARRPCRLSAPGPRRETRSDVPAPAPTSRCTTTWTAGSSCATARPHRSAPSSSRPSRRPRTPCSWPRPAPRSLAPWAKPPRAGQLGTGQLGTGRP